MADDDDQMGGDEALWHHVMKEVKPLEKGKKRVTKKTPKVSVSKHPFPLHPIELPPPVESRQRSSSKLESGALKDVDAATAKKLKSGQYSIDYTIDLHGHTQEEAFAMLYQLIPSAYAAGKRCLLVITGKGKPTGEGILRKQLSNWLNLEGLREYIVMFTAAAPKDGGSGAFYVLLRRRR